MDYGKRPPLDEQKSLWEATVAAEGVTTSAGEATGLSLEDIRLAGAGVNSFVSMLAIIHPGDPQNVDSKDVTAFDNGSGEVTVASAFKGGQVAAGVPYKIVTFRFVPAEVAALETKVERVDFYNRVFYDSIRGIAGTGYPIGTPQVPSNTIADAITILAARNLKALDVHGAVTLAVDVSHKDFFGNYHESIADIVTLGAGNDVDDSHFERLIITGAQGGTAFATYKECMLYNMTGFRGLAENCPIYGTLAIATGGIADFADFDHCTSVHGNITVTIGDADRVSFKDFSGGMILTAQAAGSAVLVRGISGYLEVDAMTGGTLDIYANAADIQINADCTGGTINIYGNARVTDASAGGCTVNDHTKETQLDTLEGKVDDIEAKVDAGVPKLYVEQIPDTDFDLTSITEDLASNPPDAPAANSVVDIDVNAGDTFVLRSLFVKINSFGTGGNKLTFKLWTLLNTAVTMVDEVDVTSLGIQNLADIFGLQEVHGDGIWITVQSDATPGSDDADCEGTYKWAKAT